MIEITATKLRAKLFKYLDIIEQGETITIHRHNKKVVKMQPIGSNHHDWRNKPSHKIKINTSSKELIKPLDNTWEEYL